MARLKARKYLELPHGDSESLALRLSNKEETESFSFLVRVYGIDMDLCYLDKNVNGPKAALVCLVFAFSGALASLYCIATSNVCFHALVPSKIAIHDIPIALPWRVSCSIFRSWVQEECNIVSPIVSCVSCIVPPHMASILPPIPKFIFTVFEPISL